MVGHHFMWEKSRDTHRWVDEKLEPWLIFDGVGSFRVCAFSMKI